MNLNWTSESVVAAVAIAVTGAGGLVTTAVQWGSVNTKIETVQQHQAAQDATIESNKKAADEAATQSAIIGQKLDDMIQRLDRIERKIK
jgi:hypothetical protein